MIAQGPDWEGFGRAVMSHWPDSAPDGFDLQALAERYRVILPVDGGFDPEKHADLWGCAEPGAPWYECNYKTEREP